MLFEIGIMIGVIIVASALAKRISGGKGGFEGFSAPRPARRRERISAAERQKALEVYESLVKEKLDVLRTALAMGYGQDDLARLDSRLEKLIGKDQLEQLAAGHAPIAGADLQNVNLSDEIRNLKEVRTAR